MQKQVLALVITLSAISSQLHAAAPDVDPLARPPVAGFAGQTAARIIAIAQGIDGALDVLTDSKTTFRPTDILPAKC